MAALIDVESLATNPKFVTRVKAAMLKAAIDVQAEDPGTANHRNRTNYAHSVLHNPDTLAAQMSYGVASNPTILDQGEQATSDADLQFTINSLWDAYAGIELV